MLKIIKSFVLIIAIGFMAFGATKSYFSDTETIAGNNMTFGTLDMTISEDSLVPISLDNLKPGDVITKSIGIQNAGSIDFGSLKTSISNIQDPNSLLSQLDVTIHFISNSGTGEEATADFYDLKADSISSLELINSVSSNLLAGNAGSVEFSISVPTELGNEYQAVGASFDLSFDAIQV